MKMIQKICLVWIAFLNTAVAYIWILGGFSPETGWLVYVNWDIRRPRPDSMHEAALLGPTSWFARVQLAVNGTCLATFDQPELDYALESVNVSAFRYDMEITCFTYKRKYEGRCKIKGKPGPSEYGNFNWSAQIFWGPPPYTRELSYFNHRQLQFYPDDFDVPLCEVEPGNNIWPPNNYTQDPNTRLPNDTRSPNNTRSPTRKQPPKLMPLPKLAWITWKLVHRRKGHTHPKC